MVFTTRVADSRQRVVCCLPAPQLTAGWDPALRGTKGSFLKTLDSRLLA